MLNVFKKKRQKVSLEIPVLIFKDLIEVGRKNNKTPTEVLQTIIKFGLVAIAVDEDPNQRLLIENLEDDEIKEIVMFTGKD